MKNGMLPAILAVIVLSLATQGLLAAEETVQVTTVRIFIGEAKYDWTADGLAFDPESANGGSPVAIKPETIRSFLSVRPGLAVNEATLERRCLDSERRLLDSGYVYEASVIPLASKGGEGERMVVVSVTEGFLLRFGGGGIWAMAGKAALFGDRASLLVYAGYNKSGFRFMHSDVGGTPLALGARLFYYGPGEYDGKYAGSRENRFYGALTAGWYLTSDLLLGVDGACDRFGFSSSGLFSLQPFAIYQQYLAAGTGSEWGGEARGYWYPDLDMSKGDLTAWVHAGFTGKTVLALSGSVGFSPDELPPDAGFDLYYTEDRNVRSGYAIGELVATDYALASVELRHDFLTFKFPPAFPCIVQGFAFCDVAMVDPVIGEKTDDTLDAYGAGVRILFENPVFAYFTFTYGVNHEGDGRFIFCGTAGY